MRLRRVLAWVLTPAHSRAVSVEVARAIPARRPAMKPAEPRAAVILAVSVDAAGEDEERAIRIMRDHGARRIERAVGNWANGSWVDFDPRRTPQFV